MCQLMQSSPLSVRDEEGPSLLGLEVVIGGCRRWSGAGGRAVVIGWTCGGRHRWMAFRSGRRWIRLSLSISSVVLQQMAELEVWAPWTVCPGSLNPSNKSQEIMKKTGEMQDFPFLTRQTDDSQRRYSHYLVQNTSIVFLKKRLILTIFLSILSVHDRSKKRMMHHLFVCMIVKLLHLYMTKSGDLAIFVSDRRHLGLYAVWPHCQTVATLINKASLQNSLTWIVHHVTTKNTCKNTHIWTWGPHLFWNNCTFAREVANSDETILS